MDLWKRAVQEYKEEYEQKAIEENAFFVVDSLKNYAAVDVDVTKGFLAKLCQQVYEIWKNAGFRLHQNSKVESLTALLVDSGDSKYRSLVTGDVLCAEINKMYASVIILLIGMLKEVDEATILKAMTVVEKLVPNSYDFAQFLVGHDDFVSTVTLAMMIIESKMSNVPWKLLAFDVIVCIFHHIGYDAQFIFKLIILHDTGFKWLLKFIQQLKAKPKIDQIMDKIHKCGSISSTTENDFLLPSKQTLHFSMNIRTPEHDALTLHFNGLKSFHTEQELDAPLDPEQFRVALRQLCNQLEHMDGTPEEKKILKKLTNAFKSVLENR